VLTSSPVPVRSRPDATNRARVPLPAGTITAAGTPPFVIDTDSPSATRRSSSPELLRISRWLTDSTTSTVARRSTLPHLGTTRVADRPAHRRGVDGRALLTAQAMFRFRSDGRRAAADPATGLRAVRRRPVAAGRGGMYWR
jgi:hypothetical protein